MSSSPIACEKAPVLLRGLKIGMPLAASAMAPRWKLPPESEIGDAAGTGTNGIRQMFGCP